MKIKGDVYNQQGRQAPPVTPNWPSTIAPETQLPLVQRLHLRPRQKDVGACWCEMGKASLLRSYNAQDLGASVI